MSNRCWARVTAAGRSTAVPTTSRPCSHRADRQQACGWWQVTSSDSSGQPARQVSDEEKVQWITSAADRPFYDGAETRPSL